MMNIAEVKSQHYHVPYYANCIPVKGLSRTMLVDLGRRNLYFIDTQLL